jgi:hypothetical protein
LPPPAAIAAAAADVRTNNPIATRITDFGNRTIMVFSLVGGLAVVAVQNGLRRVGMGGMAASVPPML